MRTSMSETILIERFLQGELSALERQTFKAQMLQNPRLRLRVYFQKKVHLLVKLYHRKRLKAEMETVHEELFRDPRKLEFQKNVTSIFHKTD